MAYLVPHNALVAFAASRSRHKDESPDVRGFPFGASGDYSLQLVSVQSAFPNRLGA